MARCWREHVRAYIMKNRTTRAGSGVITTVIRLSTRGARQRQSKDKEAHHKHVLVAVMNNIIFMTPPDCATAIGKMAFDGNTDGGIREKTHGDIDQSGLPPPRSDTGVSYYRSRPRRI